MDEYDEFFTKKQPSFITVLKGDRSSRKQYTIVDGVVTKGVVTKAYKHDVEEFEVNNIEDVYAAIKQAATDPHKYIIRGKSNGVNFDVRATKDNFAEIPTQWICFDFDEIETGCDNCSIDAINYCIKYILPPEFHNSTFVYQWSSSAGLEYEGAPIKKGTNVHIFFYIDKPLTWKQMLLWFPCRKGQQYYKKIDDATFRIVQPIFIYPIADKDDVIVDKIERRIGIVCKKTDVVIVPELREIVEIPIQQDFKFNTKVTGNILDALSPYIHHKQRDTWNLESPQENKSKGGFFIFTDDPYWVHHKDASRGAHVSDWLKEHHGVDYKIELTNTEVWELVKRPGVDYTKKSVDIKKELPISGTIEECFDIPKSLAKSLSRDERQKVIRTEVGKWLNGDFINLILYAFEGYGKSYVVHILQSLGIQVMFTSTSNDQAEEQYHNFLKQGLNCQLITSRQYRLKQLGYGDCLVFGEAPDPWTDGELIEKATKERIVQTGLNLIDVNTLWDEIKPERPDYEQHDVVFTTHARLWVWGVSQTSISNGTFMLDGEEITRSRTSNHINIIPQGVVCIWDDCASKDFEWLTNFDNKFADKKYDGRLLEQRQIGNRHYFVKPRFMRYGYGLKNRMIFTTTEILTSTLINECFKDKCYIPELMPDGAMVAGNVTLFRTKMTAASKDGLLLPLSQRLKKEGFDHYFIGDGMGLDVNLINNKGKNCFTDKDVVIELSQAHQDRILMLMAELNWNDSQAIKTILALDSGHQALGRNGGYRFLDADTENQHDAVLLIDPSLYQAFISNTRYHIAYSEDLDDLNYSSYRKRPRKGISDCIAWYVQNYNSYILGEIGAVKTKKEKIYGKDCIDAIMSINILKRVTCAKRIQIAHKKYQSGSKIKLILDDVAISINRVINPT